ncbi:MAG: class I SAM-dependent methyltransferase [Pseudomonadota bacterium]
MNQIEYENYHDTSKAYDNTRIPIGIDIFLGCFASTPRPLLEQNILDGGCGTGNYIQALKEKVGHLYGLELNEGMLAQAREKCQNDANIQLEQGSLLEPLPYHDETFDGMMSNQVLHHLVAASSPENFEPVHKLIKEAQRILRPQGVLVFNTSSHPQLYDGFWWADLIPEAVGKIAKRFPPIEIMTSMLKEVGFHKVGIVVPVDAVLQGENYLDPMGPLKKDFRDGDSTWSLATDEELERAFERVQTLNKKDSMAQYLDTREKLRKNIGQTTFIFAYK